MGDYSKDKFKTEDDDEYIPYQHLEKSQILQECRAFNDSSIVTNSPRKCSHLITKLLHLLNQGENLSSSEVTDVFFGVTKLFQSQDLNLRRMVYLFIKEVSQTCNPDDIIIVTSSLTKDMNSNQDLFRANAIRVLSRIIDQTMLGAIERYIEQAIVDQDEFVSSSALISGQRFLKTSPEVVRGWINQIQGAINSPKGLVQFHALMLLFQVKRKDRLAVSKIVTQLMKNSPSSPLATCLLIRYISKLLKDNTSNVIDQNAAFRFLEVCLRNKNEMVIYEAAKAICNMPGAGFSHVEVAVSVLELLLNSSKPTYIFAALKTLSKVANDYPDSVARCNSDMESLISNSNRSISTLAITTLLKTGSENSVDRLMKQISSFMTEINDEFKIVVIDAIRQLCLKNPEHFRVITRVGFMASFLREEGGADFKKSIVDAIIEIMHHVPETKESSLFHLCEFIEDCEFPELSSQILHLLGTIGPTTREPSRYIRFIFNRVILESSLVRAAAIHSLGMFAASVPDLRKPISELLKKTLRDEDDETRDRAVSILEYLKGENDNDIRYILTEELPMSFSALEKATLAYNHLIKATEGQALTLTNLPIIEEEVLPPSMIDEQKQADQSSSSSLLSEHEKETSSISEAQSAIYDIEEFKPLGRIFRSSKPIALTEDETEYVVKCIKHILPQHIILQFNVHNTIQEQRLLDCVVNLTVDEDELYNIEHIIPIESLHYDQNKPCYILLRRDIEMDLVPASVECELHFRVVDVDPATGEVDPDDEGFEEDYSLEGFEITTADYMARVNLGDFKRQWEQLGTDGEVLDKFAMQFKSLDDAVKSVIDYMGMQPCDGTEMIPASDGTKKSHTIHLSGIFLGNVPVAARAMVQIGNDNIILKIAVRSGNENISRMVTECIR